MRWPLCYDGCSSTRPAQACSGPGQGLGAGLAAEPSQSNNWTCMASCQPTATRQAEVLILLPEPEAALRGPAAPLLRHPPSLIRGPSAAVRRPRPPSGGRMMLGAEAVLAEQGSGLSPRAPARGGRGGGTGPTGDPDRMWAERFKSWFFPLFHEPT